MSLSLLSVTVKISLLFRPRTGANWLILRTLTQPSPARPKQCAKMVEISWNKNVKIRKKVRIMNWPLTGLWSALKWPQVTSDSFKGQIKWLKIRRHIHDVTSFFRMWTVRSGLQWFLPGSYRTVVVLGRARPYKIVLKKCILSPWKYRIVGNTGTIQQFSHVSKYLFYKYWLKTQKAWYIEH